MCYNASGTEGHMCWSKRGGLKVNWKLLIWPSLAIRFGLEQNIYLLSTLCFSPFSLPLFSHRLYLFPHLPYVLPSFLSVHRYRFWHGEQRLTYLSLWNDLYYSFHPCCSDYLLCMWMNSAVPGNQLINAISGACTIRSALTFSPASVEPHRCGYKESTLCWRQLCCTR